MPSQPPFPRSFSFDNDDDGHFQHPPPLPPPPPQHRNFDSFAPAATGPSAYDALRTPNRQSITTPGMDNLGESAAGGGIAGIALGVANSNERESGLRALRGADPARDRWGAGGNSLPGNQQHHPYSAYSPYNSTPSTPHHAMNPAAYSSQEPFANPSANVSRPSLNSHSNRSANDGYSSFSDDPYQYHSRSAPFGAIDPNDIEDDGDDGIPPPDPKRKTLLSKKGAAAAAAGAGGAAALANLNRDGSGNYGPLPGGNTEYTHDNQGVEKAGWGQAAANKNGKKRLLTIVLVALVVVAVIVGVVVGGVLGSRAGQPDDSSNGPSAASDTQKNGDLDKNSDEIKALMNNPDLHVVFPGMDYTPLNAQYPDCLHNPPSQNNITRDVAVMSQLTPAIRLYGTDCNQTEMVLHAIDRLGLTDTKVWLGVWLGNNDTTNDRQLSQFWEIMDKHQADPFAGVIVGNEVLYRKDLTATELGKILGDVKKNLTSHNWDLPLATSDLGDNWTEDLATEVDVIMANIHPFFAGVEASQAASWTWSFWQNKDVAVTKNLQGKTHVISETGWPSGGGNDCGASTCTSDTQGSVAGVDEMNIFLEDWVCQALKNGTEYFWFELFDEPWKIMYNTKDENWEDKWGLMTVNRELKSGVKIPDCGGQKATLSR
ncbi:Glycoside hydrolase family 17 [Neofusicoccum parvum]|uniref:Glycoside hydrolase family 17 n=1 Tax=Neofusicoccum parvum TaxID=310453 RepID=A0ACB5RQI4_9PEZI|nr:Glycoside hydrolase family 17 [Neofusicoccum parvum]GME45411.1 Glycoside hydrolase family 17 [Neofusicoccum parvum]